jgi:hypothetical protein
MFIVTAVVITPQASGREQWYQCVRSKKTHERQTVIGSKVISLGKGPFRQSKASNNPKLIIAPGWESGECLINIQAFEDLQRNTTSFPHPPQRQNS